MTRAVSEKVRHASRYDQEIDTQGIRFHLNRQWQRPVLPQRRPDIPISTQLQNRETGDSTSCQTHTSTGGDVAKQHITRASLADAPSNFTVLIIETVWIPIEAEWDLSEP